ncbi:pilus assembly protein [Anaeromyxobacter terrae]|uniref:pilus assembly protein PilY n=1 Tax=Anaeromyxobacter terrae TaxID=2925406 RepID=UPI001F5963D2|nr:pilus assembly protein PilY [Anaeromyxobacter sp. SG22]
MTPRTSHALRLLPLAVAVALLVPAADAPAETCLTPAAARGLVATSYVDTLLNGSDLEDASFFTATSGVPNIFILLGNATSMRRLPPNGPSTYPGTRPPLVDPTDNTAGLNAYNADCDLMVNCPVMGCGDDPVSLPYAGNGSLIQWLRDRTFQPSCGATVTAMTTLNYDSSKDYADEGRACPYYSQGSNAVVPALDASHPGGYDPDFYCGSTGDNVACGSRPNLFDKELVYHDTNVQGPTGLPANAADGWAALSVNPAARKNGAILAIDNFCSGLYGNADQGALTKTSICASCLRTRGFFLDGRQFRAAVDGGPVVSYPSIYFTGNWLNFYPPKIVMARKILKDVVMSKVNVRMGIAHFGDTGADHTSGQWQPLAPTCDMQDSNWTSSRSTYINAINAFPFNRPAPLARSLLDVGQYYHTPDLPWFGLDTTWNASTGSSGGGSGGSTNQQSICYSCQASSVIVLVDRAPAATEGNTLPGGSVTADDVETQYAGATSTGIVANASGATGIPTELCADCAKFDSSKDWLNNPIRVSWYLHNFDLRRNNENTEDCALMGGKQGLDVYTLGLGAEGDAATMLQSMSKMGGGAYEAANDAPTLKQALENMFIKISERSTSFSVATVSTLQTTSGQSVIVPRFEPGPPNQRMWQGHLFRYELYSEFINACQETADGTGAGDLDCDGKCMSVFLMDKDGDFIQEDGMGAFRKNDPPDAAPCYQASACSTKGGVCAVAGTGLATEYWDAQKALQLSTWRTTRKVYAVVDDKGSGGSTTPDGKIDANDTVFRLEPTDAVATKLLPYLALENGVCSQLALKIGAAGDTATANAVSGTRLFCAKTLIRYVLGADVFNDNEAKSASVWPKAATDAGQDTLPNRRLMLGDIFHSAPVVIDPPLPPDGVLCPNGLHNQCLTSLWATPVPDVLTTEDAYAGYATSSTYKNRRKVVLVGANDGLLHAFDGGAWASGDDTSTSGIDERLPPFNGYFTRGTGEELWGFLPPDLLPKLGLLAQGHQLFVDGSPMVRDVWADGTSNALGSGTKDGKKAKTEFHTVAIVGERRGGTHYFALDVTDASKLPAENADDSAAPRFLWIYPQPSDPESLAFGSTYSDFLPIAPPVGPVRIKSDSTSNALFGGLPQSTLTMPVPGATAGTTSDVPYHERWVALLSGGFDPQYVRGRGLHMVDVWTGFELFDFSLPTSGCGVASEDPRCNLKAPVPATAAMLTWGKNARRREASPNEGYFDTATFGDANGQLWVLRFSDPGELDPTTKKATNWFGARALQLQACAAQPFFYITANAAIPGGILRTFAGTGDRYNLLDRFGGTCGPDNIRACAQRSCTVTVADASNSIWSTGLGKESGSTALSTCTPAATRTYVAAPTASQCTLSAQARIAIDCTGSNDTEKNVSVTCTDGADGLSCSRSGSNGATVDLGDSTAPIQDYNWFFSIRIFQDDTLRPVFRTLAEAKTYDSNRLTLSGVDDATTTLVKIDGNPPLPTATPTPPPPTYATASDPGWALYYNHDGSVTADDHTYPVSRYDERTSSTSALYRWLSWNTIQTASAAGVARRTGSSCKVAKCTAENRRVAYHYVVDPVRGSPVLEEDGAKVFARAQNTLVPTMGDQATVFVNQKGQVQVGLTAVNPEKGATNVPTAVSRDPVPSYGVIQVSRDLHACRHSETAPASGVCK